METRDLILTKAETLTRSRGFDAFSYADLAQDIGIKKASIHYHFATKAALAQNLIARYRADFMKTLVTIADCEPMMAGRITAYLDAYRAALDDGQAVCLCVAMSAARDSFDPATLDELARFHTENLGWLTSAYALDSDTPQSDAAATLALVEGAQLMARAAQSLAPFDQATTSLRARLAQ